MFRLPVIGAAIFAACIVMLALFARDHVHLFGERSETEPEAVSESDSKAEESRVTIQFDSVSVDAGIADSDAERIQGLSGRPGLGEKEGLFFVFDRSGMHGIWMKEMKFPIDILWFDEEGKLAGLKESAAPESFPDVFRPDSPALYVLEVNAGFAEQHGIEIGDQAKFVYGE